MPPLVWAMIVAGAAALLLGPPLALPRFRAATGPACILVLGPVFEAAALAMFAAEHFFDAHALAPIVPRWLPAPLFWTYFVGIALLAAAVSFLAWRCVRWSATLLALLFFIIVVTIDLPSLPHHLHGLVQNRLFWTLTVRELCFAAGALVLAGSAWPSSRAGRAMILTGRTFVAAVFLFYAAQHFLFPRFVPGVPLEKLIPAWFPAPTLLSDTIGLTLLATGIGLLIPRTATIAAAIAGTVLAALTALFYVPILLTELHTPLALEGLNYVGDTLLFAGTALLAGFNRQNAHTRIN